MSMSRSADLDTPFGPIRVTATALGVAAIDLPDDVGRGLDHGGDLGDRDVLGRGRSPGDEDATAAILRDACMQLEQYLAGERDRFEVSLDPGGTEFQRLVWQLLVQIPYGELWSYRDVARALGRPRAARAVGGANGANPVPIIVPCHRVIAADGGLGGYSGGVEIKRWLIDHEQRHPRR